MSARNKNRLQHTRQGNGSERMKHAFAKSVSNVMWKWASHGNAWHATHGKTKKVSQRTAQVRNAAFYRICTTCEGMKTCCGCSTRKAAADFSAGAWKRTQARTRLCLVCARNAHASRKRQVAFNNGHHSIAPRMVNRYAIAAKGQSWRECCQKGSRACGCHARQSSTPKARESHG